MTDKVADLIAASATFQTWVSAANEAAAKPRAYQYPTENSSITRPCAFVWPPSNEQIGLGGYGNGSLELHFESAVTSTDTDAVAAETFSATCRAIVREMMVTSQQSGRLLLRSIALADPMARARYESSPFFMVAYRVLFGPEPLP